MWNKFLLIERKYVMCHLLCKRSHVKIKKIATMNWSKKEWMSQNEYYTIPRSHTMDYMEEKKSPNKIYNVLCIFCIMLFCWSFVPLFCTFLQCSTHSLVWFYERLIVIYINVEIAHTREATVQISPPNWSLM